MIFALNRDSHVPLYNQIAIQVREMIVRGALKVGDRLPANRELAKSLGVNRSTVTTAYEELTADGLIVSRIGSGTFVSAVPHSRGLEAEEARRRPSPMPWSALLADQKRDEWLSGMMRTPAAGKTLISLDYALPAPELFPVDDFRRAVDRVLRREARGFLQLGTSDGYPPLLQYLATHMKRAGVNIEPGEILITNGCQQSLDLIRQILVRPGEEVVLENPTYPGAISVFCSQAKYISVPVGPGGLDLEMLEDVLRQRRPKLIYTIPSFHNPTGITMDLAARRRLIELAAFYRVPIIEDDIFGELRYGGVSLPPLKSLDEYGLVIYINSFSKVGFPGLRVGWIVAPPIVIEHLHAVKQRTDLHASLLSQAVISDFVRRGLLAKHIRRCRKEYAQRRDAMLSALARYFPGEAAWNRPEGGMSIWVKLPETLDARQILMQAIEQGVSYSPGEFFYSSTPRMNMLRLSFTMMNPAAIEDAVRRLGAVIKARLAKKRPDLKFRGTIKPLM